MSNASLGLENLSALFTKTCEYSSKIIELTCVRVLPSGIDCKIRVTEAGLDYIYSPCFRRDH